MKLDKAGQGLWLLYPRDYRRYLTGLKLQYAAGSLDRSAMRGISRSTRRRWKGLTAAGFYFPPGTEIIDCNSTMLTMTLLENKRLKQLLRAAVCLLAAYRKLLEALTVTREHLAVIASTIQRLLDYATNSGFRQQLLRCLPFSVHQWAAWNSRKDCKASLVNLCRRKHPFRLATGEIAIINYATADKSYLHWPLSSIYYQLMRDEKLHCSLSTFYKYCRLLGVTRPRHVSRKKHESLKAAAPLSTLHMDVTIFKTVDGVKYWLYVIRDNFSRALLACKASLTYSSAIAKETLYKVLKTHGLLEHEGHLITDGGSENCGAVTELLARPGMLWKSS